MATLKCECGKCDVCKARERMRRQREENPEHVRALDRARYYRDKKKRRAAMDEYARTHREQVNGHKRSWAERNPEKYQANYLSSNALRDGRLVKGPCEREAEGDCHGRVEKHHDDYSKPLEVRWLCSKHHGETRRLEGQSSGPDAKMSIAQGLMADT